MTEPTEKTREELEAELAALRAQQNTVEKVAPELSTRDRSPVKPQDRKPKAELKDGKAEVEYEGELFEVDFEALDDAELFGKDETNPFVQAQAVKSVLSEDGYLRLCDVVRGPDGRAKMSAVQEAFGKLMETAAAKNS